MIITDVRIKVVDQEHLGGYLMGFATIVFDACFVVRDIRIINGIKGVLVSMPSRKISAHCPQCKQKNPVRAKFCNECGVQLPVDTVDEQDKLYADIAHPIEQACRDMIHKKVIMEYGLELHRSRQPGYVCRFDEYQSPNYVKEGARASAT